MKSYKSQITNGYYWINFKLSSKEIEYVINRIVNYEYKFSTSVLAVYSNDVITACHIMARL